jgi:hypothetical protein
VSGGSCFFEGDQAAGELEQGEVIGWFLRPADQERSVSVEPGVAGLDDPPACTPARCSEPVADLVGAAADVRHQAVVGGELADPRVVVTAVEAERLRPLRRRLWPLDRDRVERRR